MIVAYWLNQFSSAYTRVATVFSHFSETLSGLTTLRAFGEPALHRWTAAADFKLENNARAFIAQKLVDRWLSVRLEGLGNSAVLLSVLLALRSSGSAIIASEETFEGNAVASQMELSSERVLSTAVSSESSMTIQNMVTLLKNIFVPRDEMHAIAALDARSDAVHRTNMDTLNEDKSLRRGLHQSRRKGDSSNVLKAGLNGLAVTNALSVTSVMNWAVRMLAAAESDMNSMERVLHTLESTPSEDEGLRVEDASNTYGSARPPTSLKDWWCWWVDFVPNKHSVFAPYDWRRSRALGSNLSPRCLLFGEALRREGWPSDGRIIFDSVNVQYRPGLPAALKGATFTIEPGQRVGIVGRSGSGKSSLVGALLRLVMKKPSPLEDKGQINDGKIFIDGVDISTVPVSQLRSAVAILPQDPTLFSGSVRSNLDPNNQLNRNSNSDPTLWNALKHVGMATKILSLPGKLDAFVGDNGENFSAGERQLLCMARALVQRPKVLILDEATASVDFEADVAVQRVLKSADELKGCTMLVIAHRLSTIMSSDKILVLESGEVREFDTPEALLSPASGSSLFSRMLDAQLNYDDE